MGESCLHMTCPMTNYNCKRNCVFYDEHSEDCLVRKFLIKETTNTKTSRTSEVLRERGDD